MTDCIACGTLVGMADREDHAMNTNDVLNRLPGAWQADRCAQCDAITGTCQCPETVHGPGICCARHCCGPGRIGTPFTCEPTSAVDQDSTGCHEWPECGGPEHCEACSDAWHRFTEDQAAAEPTNAQADAEIEAELVAMARDRRAAVVELRRVHRWLMEACDVHNPHPPTSLHDVALLVSDRIALLGGDDQ